MLIVYLLSLQMDKHQPLCGPTRLGIDPLSTQPFSLRISISAQMLNYITDTNTNAQSYYFSKTNKMVQQFSD